MRKTRTILLCALAACASAKSDGPTPKPAHEVVSGGARVKGGKYRMDVQVGQGIAPQPVSNGSATLHDAVVAP
jgi:hypothetical protein